MAPPPSRQGRPGSAPATGHRSIGVPVLFSYIFPLRRYLALADPAGAVLKQSTYFVLIWQGLKYRPKIKGELPDP
jgi:hypothetical protein